MAANRLPPIPAAHRKKLIQTVKVAQKAIKMDDTTYRNLLQDQYGVDSSTKLSIIQLGHLLEIFRNHGFKPVTKKPSDKITQPQYIRALWQGCVAVGAIQDASDSALNAFVSSQLNRRQKSNVVYNYRLLDTTQCNEIIAALKAIHRRATRQQETP